MVEQTLAREHIKATVMSLVRSVEPSAAAYRNPKLYSLNEKGYNNGTTTEIFDPDRSNNTFLTDDSYPNQSYEKYFLDSPTDVFVQHPVGSGGEAISISGCDDDQTSADTSALSKITSTGAMTFCFIQAIEHSPQGTTYGSILNSMRNTIRNTGNDSGGIGGSGGVVKTAEHASDRGKWYWGIKTGASTDCLSFPYVWFAYSWKSAEEALDVLKTN